MKKHKDLVIFFEKVILALFILLEFTTLIGYVRDLEFQNDPLSYRLVIGIFGFVILLMSLFLLHFVRSERRRKSMEKLPPFSIDNHTLLQCNTNRAFITVPETVTRIAEWAFNVCETDMTDILIPDSVKDIPLRTFLRVENLTIHAAENSYGAWFAESNGFPLVVTDRGNEVRLRPAAITEKAVSFLQMRIDCPEESDAMAYRYRDQADLQLLRMLADLLFTSGCGVVNSGDAEARFSAMNAVALFFDQRCKVEVWGRSYEFLRTAEVRDGVLYYLYQDNSPVRSRQRSREYFFCTVCPAPREAYERFDEQLSECSGRLDRVKCVWGYEGKLPFDENAQCSCNRNTMYLKNPFGEGGYLRFELTETYDLHLTDTEKEKEL